MKVLPARTIFTQYGATGPRTVVESERAPVESRRWKEMPLPGVRTVVACVEPAARLSRIITPALAHTLVF